MERESPVIIRSTLQFEWIEAFMPQAVMIIQTDHGAREMVVVQTAIIIL